MLNRKWSITSAATVMFVACTVDVFAEGRGGGRPSFDWLLEAFDEDASGALSKDEVPGRVWMRLSQADADGNGCVTREEFDGYRPGGR